MAPAPEVLRSMNVIRTYFLEICLVIQWRKGRRLPKWCHPSDGMSPGSSARRTASLRRSMPSGQSPRLPASLEDRAIGADCAVADKS